MTITDESGTERTMTTAEAIEYLDTKVTIIEDDIDLLFEKQCEIFERLKSLENKVKRFH